MANPNRKFSINFNIMLDEKTDNMLIAIASDLQLSKSHVCRTAIQRIHAMKFNRVPTCADGQDCRCPHTHIYPPSQPESTKSQQPPPDRSTPA